MTTGSKVAIGASALAVTAIGYYLITSYAAKKESGIKAGIFSGLSGLLSAGSNAFTRLFPSEETSTGENDR